MQSAVHELVKKTIVEHKRVIFNGNGYAEDWVKEAEKRGLYNLKSTPDALPAFIAEKNVELFTKHGVFTKTEVYSRYEILLENYSKTIHIESLTLQDMVNHQFLPALMKYIDTVSNSILQKKQVSADLPVNAETKLLKKLSDGYEKIYDLVEKLKEDTDVTEKLTDSIENAKAYHDVVIADMEALRVVADEMETLIPSDILPYPSYEDMLFYV